MADVKQVASIPCQFEVAWVGTCKKPSDNGRCTEHENEECDSCGAKATRSCDHTAGSFCCGASLCATCSHSTEGEGHVTREVLTQQIEKRKLERLAKVNSRSSPVQRRDPVSGLPVNLFELLKGDWKEEGFHLAKVYALELDHSLMAYLPALVVEEDQIIYTTDKELLRQIWNLLPPRKSKMRSGTGYVNPKKRVVYFDKDTRHQQEESTPAGLLDQELFRELCKRDTPFGWARGLIGSDDLSSEQFQVMIEKALRHLE